MNTIFRTPTHFWLRLPDGTVEILTDNDWNRVVIMWRQLAQTLDAQSSPENRPKLGLEVFLRGLVSDVVGFGGEHIEEVFYRRYGTDLIGCIQSQVWFSEVSEILTSLPADIRSIGVPNSLPHLSRRRTIRLRAWKVRAEVIANAHFQDLMTTTWTPANSAILLLRVSNVASQLDKEDLEILLNTGLPLHGSPKVRRKIEAILSGTMESLFHERLQPDPWACVWQTPRSTSMQRIGRRRPRATQTRLAVAVS